MEEDNLIFEAGVYYRFPPSWKPNEECPRTLREFRYERFKDGKSYGIGRVFILTRQPVDFYRLLDSWNRKGANSGYTYVGQV